MIVKAVALCLALQQLGKVLRSSACNDIHVYCLKSQSHIDGAHLLYTIIRIPSLVNLLPLNIMAALHDPISCCCPSDLRLLTVWRTTPQKVLIRSLGLCSVVGILCHGEAADLGQVAQNVTDQGLYVQDTALSLLARD